MFVLEIKRVLISVYGGKKIMVQSTPDKSNLQGK